MGETYYRRNCPIRRSSGSFDAEADSSILDDSASDRAYNEALSISGSSFRVDGQTVSEENELIDEPSALRDVAVESVAEYVTTDRHSPDAARKHWLWVYELLTGGS